MSLGAIIAVAIGAILALAAIAEAWLKRNRYRPLLTDEKRRRVDDPSERNNTSTSTILSTSIGSTSNGQTQKVWHVTKDPQKYAQVMMPEAAKDKRK
ncbi:hypothetical protein [Cognatishimia sp. WU-CL00825]|uniref:hypothetical protein n=1 Tax=Cognatishimia sp. WU-CL00825 TaxID=3127658 RepID=UPI0033653478